MSRKRLATIIIAVLGALLALALFRDGFQSTLGRFIFDGLLLGIALVGVARVRPARTVQREVLRLINGVLFEIVATGISSGLATWLYLNPGWSGSILLLLASRIPHAFTIAWVAWSFIRLDGYAWQRRRRSVIVFGALLLIFVLTNVSSFVISTVAILFALFVMPWSWIEQLKGRRAWLIFLLLLITPFAFIFFIGGVNVSADEHVSSAGAAQISHVFSSNLYHAIYAFIAFAWFVLPLRLIVGFFQGLFGIRIPIWLKFGTTYVFSTIIPGILLLLLMVVIMYLGFGTFQATMVRDLVLDDLRSLERTLREDKLPYYSAGDSVMWAQYQRVFPESVRGRAIAAQPNPMISAQPPAEPLPLYGEGMATLPANWDIYARIDSVFGGHQRLEVWILKEQLSGGSALPDTLSPFPGWTFTSTSKTGLLPYNEGQAAFAAAVVPPDNPTTVRIAMRPLTRQVLEGYKEIVKSDITIHPFRVVEVGEEEIGARIQAGDGSDYSISTESDNGNSFWDTPLPHGVAELQSWSGSEGWESSTMIGQITVQTSLSSLTSSLYAWEGMNRVIVIVILALAALFGLAFLFSTLLAGGITRTIMRSVAELRHGTERLRRGDLEVQIPHRSNDELGDLAVSFNQMTDDLRRMISEVTVKERLEREVQIARRIQVHLLPADLPQRPTLQVGARSDPAFEVGGDYYDCIDLDERGLLVALGDVSGKGIGAAVLMSNLQASLSLLVGQGLDIEEMVRQLNVQVYKNSTPEMFITFFAALFDPHTNMLTYVNAGHDVPILIRYGKNIDLESGGMLLGIMPDAEYTVGQIEVKPGDVFAAYSDGLTEAMNENDEEFGRERLISTLNEYKHLDAHHLVIKVLEEIRDYAGHERAGRDDLTLLAVRVIEE